MTTKEQTPFNELTPAEAERLALLAEELGEAIQAIGKILRHGYESCHPDNINGPDNRSDLEREIGDIAAALHYMTILSNDLDEINIDEHMRRKIKNVKQYLHHQGPEDD